MNATLDTTITVILATGNRDKVKELRPLLEDISPLITVTTLSELGAEVEIEETEETLEGNALLKARGIFELLSERFPSMIALADDTGLEVEALGGAPGVYSARFAPMPEGKSPSYQDNVRHLLASMAGCSNRKALFRTVIALKGRIPAKNGDPLLFEHLAEGEVPGTITLDERGSEGFGYDPVFMLDSTARTYAEMGIAEKNRLSHRSLAVQKAVVDLRETFYQQNIPITHSSAKQ
ncbi:RdgB/HAM1 family non-canonical purine NTP pyrophosphatase [Chlorobium ferrooxidans]|uniref:dITP/XTP pyrophosphatase n=1 Tax=Chlorobium ferrooxidans DSM 13031 TaxID=377431 RepID=Q0YUP1_9CHLB|nr:RdgB/HAM1 family non-canonical purine NTP pyrophosphatase [Chlorobium ferrooxidans]EAT59991.1 Ham1-like protein [Chlorobium ferrooxidans DSM 13031]